MQVGANQVPNSDEYEITFIDVSELFLKWFSVYCKLLSILLTQEL